MNRIQCTLFCELSVYILYTLYVKQSFFNNVSIHLAFFPLWQKRMT